MFADPTTAQRVERAEVQVTRDMVSPHVGSARAPDAFVRDADAGVAAYLRPGSPMNKVIGIGIDAPIDQRLLERVERAFHERHEPVRAEIATLADPQTFERLTARGYRLIGFENVLARPLAHDVAARGDAIRIERVTDATIPAFREAVVEGAAHADDTGVVADDLSREVVETVIDDSLHATSFLRYVAYRDGALAGGGSMFLHDGVAMFTGSATLPAHRRRGVQAALLARRLADARAAGAELAVITTSPGTQSQANVMKLGFALVYARALLVLAPAL